MLRRRRKIVVIMSFEFSVPLTKFQNDWNKELIKIKKKRKRARLQSITNQEFLIARDKHYRRPGFLEIELELGETPRSAIRRFSSWSDVAIKKPWQEIDRFDHTDNDTAWEIIVGAIGFDRSNIDQRSLDIAEQSDELPFFLEWANLQDLFQAYQQRDLSYVSNLALQRRQVRAFLLATRDKPAPVVMV